MYTQQQKMSMLKSVEGIVKTLADKYTGVLCMDELIQIGNNGVLAAIERFDENISKFSTYAYHYARGYMLKAISNYRLVNLVPAGDNYDLLEDTSCNQTDLEEFWEDMLSNLTKLEKRVITLYYREDMDTRKIAKKLRVSHETIRTIRDGALKFMWLRERDRRINE